MNSNPTKAFLDQLGATAWDPDRALQAWRIHESTLIPKTRGTRRLIHPDHHFDGLVDIFAAPSVARIMRDRPRAQMSERLMHMPFARALDIGGPAFTPDLDQFRVNYWSYSNGLLRHLDNLDNLVIAGGAVEASLLPVSVTGTAHTDRIHFYNDWYRESDIDIFTYGLEDDQVHHKAFTVMKAIEAATHRAVEVRETENAYTFTVGPEWRVVQLVKQKYGSPAEILANFDLDACCALYTGDAVWLSPRAVVAMCTLTNRVDFTKATTSSYEARLAKYAIRGYQPWYPGFERSQYTERFVATRSLLNRMHGIRMLMALEFWMLRSATRQIATSFVRGFHRAVHPEDYVDDRSSDEGEEDTSEEH